MGEGIGVGPRVGVRALLASCAVLTARTHRASMASSRLAAASIRSAAGLRPGDRRGVRT